MSSYSCSLVKQHKHWRPWVQRLWCVEKLAHCRPLLLPVTRDLGMCFEGCWSILPLRYLSTYSNWVETTLVKRNVSIDQTSQAVYNGWARDCPRCIAVSIHFRVSPRKVECRLAKDPIHRHFQPDLTALIHKVSSRYDQLSSAMLRHHISEHLPHILFSVGLNVAHLCLDIG